MIRRHLKILVTLVILLVIGIGFLLNQNSATPPPLSAEQKTLMLISDRCAGISENSVADKKAVVAFQQLEIQGNKANVVVSCMRDNGYGQNPAWLKYAQPIAKTDAEKNNISVDEALTALARRDMLLLNQEKNRPIYWVKLK
ncbi:MULTISPECIES: hypothetical protein [Methylotenera]|uniref:hypothetical protein n=1 Tax=Methylotenera TaxID=359407 RepID=UPI0003724D0D|nr:MULTISPECIES: hypothetical protein [Methylotenera]